MQRLTNESVLSGFPNTEKCLEKKRGAGNFFNDFEVFDT